MGPGFTVKASVLQAKGEGATSLQQYCQAVGRDAVGTLAVMSGSTGHAGLASALTDAAGWGDLAFAGMLAAYSHAATGLTTSAQRYAGAEWASTMPFFNGTG